MAGTGKRRKQGELPGVEQERIKEIETAAEDYLEKMRERVAQSKIEVEAKTLLINMMEKHGQTIYRDTTANPPVTVILKKGKPGVKVEVAETEEEAAEKLAG